MESSEVMLGQTGDDSDVGVHHLDLQIPGLVSGLGTNNNGNSGTVTSNALTFTETQNSSKHKNILLYNHFFAICKILNSSCYFKTA